MVLGGRVVIIEFLLKDLEDPGVMTLTDLSMLTLAGARSDLSRSSTRCCPRRDCGAPACRRRTLH
jgi:hypothetical protein